MVFRNLVLFVSRLKVTEKVVRGWKPFRKLVTRFIAGDSLEEALAAAELLAQQGFLVTLDYLGENTKSEAEALAAKAAYIKMLERIHASPHKDQINISIKLTQCGLDQGIEFAEANFREVLGIAAPTFVRVDMEASDYTQRTIDMILKVSQDCPNTGTVLQSSLYRTPKDIETMIERQLRTRIVKGAYLEPESVAHQKKADVDKAYVECAKRLMESGNYPAIATHDETIVAELLSFAAEKGIDASRYEMQMLFGIARPLQERLRSEGHPVRIYVPFGDAWYPYFSRRLAERPANVLFILKALKQ